MWLLCDGHDHQRPLARRRPHLLQPFDVDVDAVEDLAEHPRHDRPREAEHPRLGIGGDLAQRGARALLDLRRRKLLRALDLLGLGDEPPAAQHLLLDAMYRLARRPEHDAHLRLDPPTELPAQPPGQDLVVGRALLLRQELRQLERLPDQHLRVLVVGEEGVHGAHAPRRLALAEDQIDDAAPRARRAHRRRAPHQRQRHEDDRPPRGAALALDADQLLDVGAAKLRRLPAEQRVRPLQKEQRRFALPDHPRQLCRRRRASLAPQPERAGEDAAHWLHQEGLDPVGEARQRQRVLEEGVREVEIVDVAERLTYVDHRAPLGGAADLLGPLGRERDLAEETAEEPA